MRLDLVFVSVCMALIAGSAGAIAYSALGFGAAAAMLTAMALFALLSLYNLVSMRAAVRRPAPNQPGDLLRIATDTLRQEAARQDALRQEMRQEIRQDMARQVTPLERNLAALERRVDGTIERTRATTEPLTAEIGELGTLVRQLAETLSDHESKLTEIQLAEIERLEVMHAGPKREAPQVTPVTPAPPVPPLVQAPPAPPAPPAVQVSFVPPAAEAVSTPAPAPVAAPSPTAAPAPAAIATPPAPKTTAADAMAATIRSAIDANRVDLYLQPMVTLPQRKIRYYEALSRLRSDNGDVVLATDFLGSADTHGLMPEIDNLVIFRCVQVIRRLLAKNREMGLFCNISGSTLTDGRVFPQLLEFLEANRAVSSSIVLEIPQSALTSAGPIELESLSALAERGYRFSLDNVTDLRFEPRDLLARGFRYVKVRADVLLKRIAVASDIDPADLADLLRRFGIDLIAERIESEGSVVDLLECGVRFGQGFVFSPPRPVRAEALQGIADRSEPTKAPSAPPATPAHTQVAAPAEATTPRRSSGLSQIARRI
jgi:cyclic-di-GMP phosphodiesterase TipF (flagellum assembly factor)